MSHHLPKDRRSAMVRPSKNDPAPIVAQINTRFHAQVHFPDTLTYFTKLSELDVQERLYDPACDRITMEYVAYSNKLGIKVASGSCLVVCFDYGKNCKLPYPLFLRKAFHAYECEPENSLANKEKVPEI
ncbi:hypothetical protein HMI56_001610 [Coelomomyces lativittatus]|nr:hypothetical protein HMI56_001610 [Coelomomyces lativittatus]